MGYRPGVIPYTNCINYLAVINQELAYDSAVGSLMGIQIPERVQYVRGIMAELDGIASQLVAIGAYR
ncbi:MAG TPA: hypothetical protein VNP04_18850 [Alphaproteobacteria bacterium]|nr:hypothetical protein [Alphaproteobacteria bacterium]